MLARIAVLAGAQVNVHRRPEDGLAVAARARRRRAPSRASLTAESALALKKGRRRAPELGFDCVIERREARNHGIAAVELVPPARRVNLFGGARGDDAHPSNTTRLHYEEIRIIAFVPPHAGRPCGAPLTSSRAGPFPPSP